MERVVPRRVLTLRFVMVRHMAMHAMTRTGGRAWAGVLAVFAAWCVLVPMAAGQAGAGLQPRLPSIAGGAWFGDPVDDALMVNANIGHAGLAVIGCWTPMRLTMASTSLEGYEGVARVRVAVDTEVRVHELPFALPPATGRKPLRETTTIFVGIVPAGTYAELYTIEFEIIGRPLGTTERARMLQEGEFSGWSGSRSRSVPTGIDRTDPIVLAIGQSSVHSSAMATQGNATPFAYGGGVRGRNMVQVIGTNMTDLPFPESRWMLYEGFDAVVLSREALDAMGEAQLRALRAWVGFGGHIVLVSDLLGVEADGLLPGGLLSAAIVDDAAGMDGMGRVSITPTETGAAQGWSVLDLPDVVAGMAVSGPVGLGWMTVLSTDPADGRELDEINAIWRSILRVDVLMALRRTMHGDSGSMYVSGWSESRSGLRGSLDHAAYSLGVEPLAGWVIGLLVLGIGLLIAVGTTFGDWFLLGSARRRRFSFLTALGWLVGGSVVALVVPLLLRAGETSAVRVQVIDINEANGGMASSEVCAIWAGRRLRFEPPGQGPESWSRRVSASAGLGNVSGGRASEQFAGNSLGAAGASLWTFHGAVNEGVDSVPGLEREALDVGARITVDVLTDEPVLEVRHGLGQIADDEVFVVFKRAEPVLDGSEVDSGLVSMRVPLPAVGLDVDRQRTVLRADAVQRGGKHGFWHHVYVDEPRGWAWRREGDDPKLLSGLPGVSLRNVSVHAALATGRYAAVTMLFDDASDEIAAMDAAAFADMTEPTGLVERGITKRWVRVLVPIDEATREALVALYDDGVAVPASEGGVP